jgi:flagellar hook-length control protein FliK
MSTILSILPSTASTQISSSDNSLPVTAPPDNNNFSTTLDQAKSQQASTQAPPTDPTAKPAKHKKSAARPGKQSKATTSAAPAKSTKPVKADPSQAPPDAASEQGSEEPSQADGQPDQQQGLRAESGQQTPRNASPDAQATATDTNHISVALPEPATAADSTPSTATPGKTKPTTAPTQQNVDPTTLAPVITGTPGKQNAPSSTASADDPTNTKVSTKPNVSPFKPGDAAAAGTSDDSTSDAATDAEAVATSSTGAPAKATDKTTSPTNTAADSGFAALLPQVGSHTSATGVAGAVPLPVAQPAEVQFAQANNPSIVSSIHSELLPDGGTMSIRLDPPELGAMQITVKIASGVISASFQTSSDQATRLLTHTLGDLKSALESQGVNVDSLHVHQSSKSENSSNQQGDSDSGRQGLTDQRSAEQEQQRRQMLRRMWKKVNGTDDPLDLVA